MRGSVVCTTSTPKDFRCSIRGTPRKEENESSFV